MKKKAILMLLTLTTIKAIAGSNFDISPTPGLAFPTTVLAGDTVSAFYTITNNTSTTRLGYRLQGYPGTVTQNTSNPIHCSNPITLTGHANCILKLDITGNAKSNFALCKGNSCTTAASPLNVTLIPTMIATGSYSNNIFNTLPLLATSKNGGTTWHYTIDGSTPTLPAGAINGLINSAYCSGQNCIAAGLYDNGSNGFPLLATSKNGGTTWHYTIDGSTPTLPAGAINGLINSAYCSGQNCIAAGFYDNGSNGFPLLATSTNGGTTWNYTIDGSTPSLPAGAVAGEFSGAHCSEQNCIAAGLYNNSSNNLPLLATSTNGGTTWSYTIDASTPNLPAGAVSGELNSAHCSGQNCIAAGFYNNGSNNFPLLATSTNGGKNWSYTIDASTPNLPAGAVSGELNSADCSGQNCIASGFYNNGSNNFPLLASSTDGAASWHYAIDASTPTLPTGANSGEFNSANCSGQNCIAAGTYSIGSNNFPLLATSTNSGKNWSYTINGSTPALPNGTISSSFNSANCSQQYCITAGSYFNGLGNFPLLATSTNGGVTWSYTIDENSPVLPADYENFGRFGSVSTSPLTKLLLTPILPGL